MTSAPSVTWAAPRYATSREESRPSLGADVLLIAERLGWPLLGWQQLVADVSCELTEAGRWAYPVVVLTVPRQCGKTALLFALMVERAMRLLDHRSAYAAQTGFEGRRLFREEWTPRIETGRLASGWKIRRGNGEETLTRVATNGLIKPFPPVPGAMHNSQSDMAVIDEAWKHPPDLGEALLQATVPTQTTRKRRQLWLVSTAGPPESVWMRRWIERGRNAEPGLAYFEWSAPDASYADDESTWPEIHPAFGQLVTLADLRDFRTSLGAAGFARAYLNVWPDLPAEVEEHATPLDLTSWLACTDPRAALLGPPVFSADADPLTHVGMIGAAGQGPRGHHVEIVDVQAGTTWLADRLIALADRHGGTIALDEGGPVGWIAEELARRHVAYTPIKPAQYARACAQLSDAVRAGLVTHPESGPLDSAIRALEIRPMGHGFIWDRRRSRGDVAALIAATLAYAGAVADVRPETSRVF